MKRIVNCTQSAHLDLFWMARMDRCMDMGAQIIEDAVVDLLADAGKYFFVETVRFLEYYLDRRPERLQDVRNLMRRGQLEVGACYTDRLENHHDGESLVRNVLYGKRVLKALTGMDSGIVAHPDLPGLAEQTPQIYRQAGVRYYTFARGYCDGARFRWAAPNGEWMIAYNYPIHYSYYDYDRLYDRLDAVERATQSDAPLISFSAGDLGPYGTFQRPGHPREKSADILAEFNRRDKAREFRFAGVEETLRAMPEDNLPTYSGECPCKWGTYGSATNVTSFQQDKRLSAALTDAEKLLALLSLNGICADQFTMPHPFCLLERPHMLRDYYDAKVRPQNAREWLDFAWRLQLVTQDHNYGGIDGAASAFDRMVYKKVALDVAERLTAHGMHKLCGAIDAGAGVVALNTLNWKRVGRVNLSGEAGVFDAAIGADGAVYPIARDARGCYFEPELDALAYGHFRIEERPAPAQTEDGIWETDRDVTLQNRYYTAVYGKAEGGLVRLVDRESGLNLLGETPLGVFSLYADPSNDVHELNHQKTLLDTTLGKPLAVKFGQDSLCAWLRWTGEVCNSKVCVTLRLSSGRKAFSIVPEVYWPGCEQSQLRLSFGLNPALDGLYYGVPYGIQRFGNYMPGSEPTNPSDEISMELFREYREVQGWFAVQGKAGGVSFGTNHSSFALRPGNDFELVLIRDVVSCGDVDVMMDNHGHQTFAFEGTSFVHDDVTVNDLYYRRALELSHPFLSMEKSDQDIGVMSATGTLLTAQGGILSVLAADQDGCTARAYSVRQAPERLAFALNGRPLRQTVCDMLGNPAVQDAKLRYGDIRTLVLGR
ncbi:MAG: hypothetical protein VB065_02710 [Eubacteriales bacterium]|nr:hypothetical protein [Christensenellaceae bacterium]MEA5064938.1 hypothetical protein [Eubacteriales bacterium]